jgi:hypothetical protein
LGRTHLLIPVGLFFGKISFPRFRPFLLSFTLSKLFRSSLHH